MNPIASPNQDVATLFAQNYKLQAQANQLQAQLQQYQYQANLLNYVPDAIIATDTELRVTLWNTAAAQIYGWSAAEALGRHVSDLLGSSLTSEERAQTFYALQSAGSYTSEAIHRHKDGHTFYIEGKTIVLKDELDQITGFVSVNRDISDRKQMELALRKSESRYQAIANLSSDFAYLTNVEPDGQLVHAWSSENLSRLIGYQAEDISTPDAFIHLFHPDDFPLIEQRTAKLLVGQPSAIEFRLITKEGKQLWMRDNAEPVWDEQHRRVIGMRGAVQDITSYKEAENALKENEWRYRTLSELTSDVSFMARIQPDFTFQVEWLSASGFNMLCLEIGQTLTIDNLGERAHPDDLPTLAQNLAQVLKGETVEAEARFFNPLNDQAWIQLQIEPVWDETTGDIMGLRGAYRDVTARKNAELALQKSNDLLQKAYKIALQHGDNVTQGLQATLQLTCETYGWDTGLFEQVSGDQCTIVALAGKQEGWQIGQAFPMEESYTQAVLCVEEWPLMTNMAWPEHPAYRPDLSHTLLSVPIFADGEQLHGTLTFVAYTPHPAIDLSEKNLIKMIGQWVGQMLGRQKNRLAQRRYEARLEILNTISQAILNAQTMFQIGLATATHLQAFFQCYQVGITAFDLDKDEGIALARIKQGNLSIVPNSRFPLRAAFPILDELLQGKTVWRENLPELYVQGRLSPNTAQLLAEGVHTLINIPIFYQADLIGSLNISLVKQDEFSSSDLEVAKEVANQLGVSIQQAHLHEATKQQLRELQVLYAVTAAAETVTDEDMFLTTVTHIIHEALALEMGGFLIVDEAMACLRPHPSYIVTLGATFHASIPLNQGIMGWVVTHGKSRYVPDMHQDPNYLPNPEEIRSQYCVPLYIADQIISVLNVGSTQLDAFPLRDQQLLTTVAQQTAQTMQGLRFEASEKRWLEQQSALSVMGQIVTSSLDLNDVLQRILDQTGQLVEAEGITILLSDESRQWLKFAAVAESDSQDLVGFRMPANKGVAGRVMQSGQPQQIHQFEEGVFFQTPVTYVGARVETLFALPLQIGTNIIGVLEAVHSRPFAFSELDYRTLQTAAAWASIAISNAHAFNNERQARQQAETLRLLANILNSTLDTEEVLQEILQQLHWMVEYDTASIMLAEANTLILAAYHNVHGGKSQIKQLFLPNFPHLQRLFVEAAPIIINNTSQSQEWQQFSETANVQAWMGIPLVAKGIVIGLLNLDKFKTDFYTEADAVLVSSFADQAATAIENAHLFKSALLKQKEATASATQLAHANQLITFLAGVALRIQSQLDPFGVQHALMTELNQLGLNGFISLLDPGDNSLQFNFEGPNEIVMQRLHEVSGLDIRNLRLNASNWEDYEQLLQNRQPVFISEAKPHFQKVINHLSSDWQQVIIDLMNVQDTMRGLVLPLLVNKQLLGTLHVWGDALFEEDVPAYTIFASQVTAALDNARLFVAEQKARQVAEILQAANLSLSKTFDLNRILESMLNYLFLLVPFDKAAIILTTQQDSLEMCAFENNGSLQPIMNRRYIPRLPLIEHILISGAGLLIADTSSDPRWVTLPGASDVACWMGIPLVAGGKTMGLYSINKQTPDFFTQEHYHLATALAGQAAVAVQNTLLYEAERAQFRKLQESQTRLIQVEKLSALGRLTASIAHEINNPIQAIQGCLTLAQEEFNREGSREEVNFYLGIVQSEIERVATIVRRMRDFYRPTEDEAPKLTDLLATVESVLSLTNKQTESRQVELIKEWETTFPYIEAKPQQLKQVFLNIILNALEAMPDGGVLRIRATVTQIRLKESDEMVAAACLEFTNSGNPIAPHILSQVFEPFYTTKEYGSGLGLSVSYSIIKAHQGEMMATSDALTGTTFTVLLPFDTHLE